MCPKVAQLKQYHQFSDSLRKLSVLNMNNCYRASYCQDVYVCRALARAKSKGGGGGALPVLGNHIIYNFLIEIFSHRIPMQPNKDKKDLQAQLSKYLRYQMMATTHVPMALGSVIDLRPLVSDLDFVIGHDLGDLH